MIIDSPHSVHVNDALVLGNYADGSIIVIQSGKTTSLLLKKSEQSLIRANVTIIGLILNKLKHRYHYYRYHC